MLFAIENYSTRPFDIRRDLYSTNLVLVHCQVGSNFFGFRVYLQITIFQSGDPLPDESLWSHFDTRDAFKRHAILHLETRIIIKSTQSKHCCVMVRGKNPYDVGSLTCQMSKHLLAPTI